MRCFGSALWLSFFQVLCWIAFLACCYTPTQVLWLAHCVMGIFPKGGVNPRKTHLTPLLKLLQKNSKSLHYVWKSVKKVSLSQLCERSELRLFEKYLNFCAINQRFWRENSNIWKSCCKRNISLYTQCMNICQKSLILQLCERSELRLFEFSRPKSTFYLLFLARKFKYLKK